MIEFLGRLLIAGAFPLGMVGTPIICLVAGVWRSRSLIHVGIGWAAMVGFGIGVGAVIVNFLVWASVYFAFAEADSVVSGNWGMLWIGVIFPYLAAPLAIAVVWNLCNRKEAALFSLDS